MSEGKQPPRSDDGAPSAPSIDVDSATLDGRDVAMLDTMDAVPSERQSPVQVRIGAGVLALPSSLGPFRIEARLGAGGMGVVYRAIDTRLGRAVALKVLARDVAEDAGSRARFLREGRAAAAATHRNIATIYEVGEAGRDLFLAMELIEGETLRHLVRPPGLPVAEVLALMRDIAAGLAAAHAVGIVHRDLKPDNIMLTGARDLRILDFGLARSVTLAIEADTANPEAAALTRDGQILGTPGYMSPEQAMGSAVDARTDVFALGVVAQELLTGRLPWRASSAMELVIKAARDLPEPLGELRPDVPPPASAS